MLPESLNNAQPQLPHNGSQNIDVQHVDEGVDRVNLKQLSQRFGEINQLRLARLHSALNPSQQIFIDLLPLLFHINHPVLPGYMPAGTPTGLRNFKPTRESIKSARLLAKSFALKRDLNPDNDICAIYLMGSCGTIAHSNDSDLDIWICPRQNLAVEQTIALTEKCRLISQWAVSLKLETHFFVMDDAEFKLKQRAKMGTEDCGNTQHYLLLDEFYRTSILLGGCQPIWWLVPDQFEGEYQHYVDTLIEKRFIDTDTFIDYGSAKSIPAEEYVTAGIWQLYKSLGAPYKAALKLLLIEVYASDHPATDNLSSQYKRMIYSGKFDNDELDPYVLIYRKIESYLLDKQDNNRLELIRRCFYFKVGVALSASIDSLTATSSTNTSEAANLSAPLTAIESDTDHPQWQRRAMQKLANEWGWTNKHIKYLDERRHWPIEQIQAEQNRLTKQLTHSYRLFASLTQNDTAADKPDQQHRHNSRELTLLGRQLYAAFERKTDKVHRIQQGVVNSLEHDHISFAYLTAEPEKDTDTQHQANDQTQRWIASSGVFDARQTGALNEAQRQAQTIKHAANPVELLAWCIINDIVTANTRVHVDSGDHDLTDYEIRQLQSVLLQHLIPEPAKTKSDQINQAFARPARIEKCILIVNAGVDPLKNQKDNGVHRISDKTDPLSFSGIQENLIANITQITTNNWGEVFCQHFSGEDAIDQCLSQYFCYAKPDGDEPLPPRKIICACPTRPTAITERLENLFDDVESCYFAASQAHDERKRYIFESANAYHVMSWDDGNPFICQYPSDTALLKKLSDPDTAGPVVIDRFALTQHPLNTIYRTIDATRSRSGSASGSNKTRSNLPENSIRIFYEVHGPYADAYFLDSDQSLSIATIPFESTRSFILPLIQLIKRSLNRRLQNELANNDPLNNPLNNTSINTSHIPGIEFYALSKTTTGYNTRQVPTESEISANYLPVSAIGSRGSIGQIEWSISCSGQQFDSASLGDELFSQLAQAIKNHRRSGQNKYRCYITDIDISDCLTNCSLAHELYYKLQLEDAVNAAFLALDD